MDTIQKLSKYAATVGSDITFIGIPKTIDNDLAETDHTPGYGSAAKYIAAAMKEIISDSNTYDTDSITVVEIMGRNAGWLTGAAALSRAEDCPGPDLIYLPERVFSHNDFYNKILEVKEVNEVNDLRKHKKAVTVAISEGIKSADGKYVSEPQKGGYNDPFGHKMLGGTALYLAEFLGRETGMKSRGIVFSTLQRCASHLVSRRDITEAYAVGADAVRIASEGATGKMTTIIRHSNNPYNITTGACDVARVANLEKKVPDGFITDDGAYVTKDFTDYISPLIIGELTPFMVDGLPRHLHL
jgi:6-phosphofructokinase 1